MYRSMVKLIHVGGFFKEGSIDHYINFLNCYPFVEKEFGFELENFNLIVPGLEAEFSKILSERVKIDQNRSGIFRRPHNNFIHFEGFDSLDEWCFISSLEKNTLNIWNHISDSSKGEVSDIDSSNALQGYNYNYRNIFEWNIHTNVMLQPNDGVFIRPWMFHSLNDGLVQYFRLVADNKFRILVTGPSNTSRKEVAKTIAQLIPNSKLLVSKNIREDAKDIDFSHSGLMRQADRMLDLARECVYDTVIIDMVCPLEEMREFLNPDVIIWVNDYQQVENDEINRIISTFDPPKKYHLKINEKIINYDEVLETIYCKKT